MTLGWLSIARENQTITFATLELPWRNNQHDISCIPAGQYQVKLLFSPSHNKKLWWITGVPGRSDVEIHVGNTVADTHGCVLIGEASDGDAITQSIPAFESLMSFTDGAGEWSLVISDPKPQGPT